MNTVPEKWRSLLLDAFNSTNAGMMMMTILMMIIMMMIMMIMTILFIMMMIIMILMIMIIMMFECYLMNTVPEKWESCYWRHLIRLTLVYPFF
jgi:hypothetical protein